MGEEMLAFPLGTDEVISLIKLVALTQLASFSAEDTGASIVQLSFRYK